MPATTGLISDLSRLRARWMRLEKRIESLEAEIEAAADYEIPELLEKVTETREKLESTKLLTAAEERRLFKPDAMLRFTPRAMRNA